MPGSYYKSFVFAFAAFRGRNSAVRYIDYRIALSALQISALNLGGSNIGQTKLINAYITIWSSDDEKIYLLYLQNRQN